MGSMKDWNRCSMQSSAPSSSPLFDTQTRYQEGEQGSSTTCAPHIALIRIMLTAGDMRCCVGMQRIDLRHLGRQLAFPRLTVNHLRYDPGDEESNNMDVRVGAPT
eukprot:759024-Hanusia_phi.AAC.1